MLFKYNFSDVIFSNFSTRLFGSADSKIESQYSNEYVVNFDLVNFDFATVFVRFVR